MAAEKVIIDPITRIEGHLRIELMREDGKIKKAWSESTQYRGIETIVQDRDPRDVWAFVGRVCGVCTGTHSVASIVAVENAIGSNPPPQAQLIRSMMLAAGEIHDHVVHFYHLHALDWVNVVSAASADPEKTVALAKELGSKWRGNTAQRFAEVKKTVQGVLDSGQLSIFTGGYWDHPDYRLPPEANLMAVAHYLDALEFQRSIIRIQTVFGGKNPHPNYLVGGMACSIDPDKSETVNQVHLDNIGAWIAEINDFVNNCYYPDVLAIMGVYKDYFSIGATQSNFLAVGLSGATYGGNPAESRVQLAANEVKPGVILDGDYTKVHDFDPAKISEYVSSTWASYAEGDVALTPDKGETTPKYTGPKPPYEWLADDPKYSFSKSPRYDNRAVSVGPVARILLGYLRGHAHTKKLMDEAMAALGITIDKFNSTAGRTLARALEAVTTAEILSSTFFPTFVKNLKGGDLAVFDATKWEPSSWPKEAQGYSLMEVARGNLSHWVGIKDGKISHYQAVVPTTWLAGGRDKQGEQGPYEHSLAGNGEHPLVDPKQPLEPLRTIHSFDPCMACAVHVLDENGGEMFQVVTP